MIRQSSWWSVQEDNLFVRMECTHLSKCAAFFYHVIIVWYLGGILSSSEFQYSTIRVLVPPALRLLFHRQSREVQRPRVHGHGLEMEMLAPDHCRVSISTRFDHQGSRPSGGSNHQAMHSKSPSPTCPEDTLDPHTHLPGAWLHGTCYLTMIFSWHSLFGNERRVRPASIQHACKAQTSYPVVCLCYDTVRADQHMNVRMYVLVNLWFRNHTARNWSSLLFR